MNFLEGVKKYEAGLLDFKRDIHEHPEESFKEFRTTERVRSALALLGAEFVDLGMDTGAAAVLRGGLPGRTVMLRADIDAVSTDEGCSHLCGHDLHTACLLGAAKVLFEWRESVRGTVVFLFQPAEEFTSGARACIEHGLFEKVHPDALFGLHCRPELRTGTVCVKEGPLMARKSNFNIEVHGTAGHAGMPHKYADVIVAGSAVVGALQTIVSRNTDPLETLVCSVSSIHSGCAENFPTGFLTMSGDVRSYSESVHEKALKRLSEISAQVAGGYGCRSVLEVIPKVPAVCNSAEMTRLARQAACSVVGEENVVSSQPSLASEDFAVLGEYAPSFFYWLGTGREGEENFPWHHKNFVADDSAVVIGAALLAESAVRFLDYQGNRDADTKGLSR